MSIPWIFQRCPDSWDMILCDKRDKHSEERDKLVIRIIVSQFDSRGRIQSIHSSVVDPRQLMFQSRLSCIKTAAHLFVNDVFQSPRDVVNWLKKWARISLYRHYFEKGGEHLITLNGTCVDVDVFYDTHSNSEDFSISSWYYYKTGGRTLPSTWVDKNSLDVNMEVDDCSNQSDGDCFVGDDTPLVYEGDYITEEMENQSILPAFDFVISGTVKPGDIPAFCPDVTLEKNLFEDGGDDRDRSSINCLYMGIKKIEVAKKSVKTLGGVSPFRGCARSRYAEISKGLAGIMNTMFESVIQSEINLPPLTEFLSSRGGVHNYDPFLCHRGYQSINESRTPLLSVGEKGGEISDDRDLLSGELLFRLSFPATMRLRSL